MARIPDGPSTARFDGNVAAVPDSPAAQPDSKTATVPDGASDTPPDSPIVTSPDSGADKADTGAVGDTRAPAADGPSLMACRTQPYQCTCDPGQPGPSDPPTCSKTSVVKDSTETGVCCKTDNYCICYSLSCVLDPVKTPGSCHCDFTDQLSYVAPQGTRLDQCSAPDEGKKCCLDSRWRMCDCNRTACADTATEVATCTNAQLAVCGPDEVTVDSCK